MGNTFRRAGKRSVFAALVTTAALALGTLAGAAPASAITATSVTAADPKTGSISGTVTTILNGVQAPDAYGYVYANSTTGGGTGAQVGTDGHYSLESLAAGSYTVQFEPSDRKFVAEYYDNAADQASSTQVPVGAGAAVTGINAVLDLGASITGTVTIGASHAPAARVNVYAYTSDQSWSISGQTDDAGQYTLDGLRAGSYKLDFEGGNANGVSEWYDNAADVGSAKAVVVAAQATVPHIDANLEPGSTITGAVTQNVGGVVSAAADVSVSVRSATGNFMNQASTDADGQYTLAGLAAGSYTVAFNGGWGSNLLTQYYQNAATASTAKPVIVAAGATVTGIDAALETGAAISGTVTKNDGGTKIAAAEVNVMAYHEDNTWADSAQTDAAGHYNLDSLAGGKYKLYFDGHFSNGVSEWYNDAADSATATEITVADHATVTADDVNLEQGSTISGTATQNIGGTLSPASNVSVSALSTSIDGGSTSYYGVSTDSDGHYSIPALAAGTYAIRFSPSQASGLISEFYDNAAVQSAAKPVQVGVGATVTGIDAELQKGGTISGTVTRNDGGTATPLQNLYATAYTSDYQYQEGVSTDAAGHYALTGLRAGSYKIRFDGYSASVLSRWYKDAPDFDSATAVVVSDTATVTGIDANLEKASSLTGTVSQIVDGVASPAANVNVMVTPAAASGYGYGYGYGSSATTDDSGHYTVTSLAAGTYSVRFTGPSVSNLVTQFYDNAADQTSSKPVQLGLGATVSGIDAVMQTGATISGTVTRNDLGAATPLASVNVSLRSSKDGAWLGNTSTDTAGHYALGGLPAGSYKIDFSGASSNAISEWYDNASDFETATPIVVSAHETVPHIDASLERGSTIEGTVTKDVGGTVSPAANVSVHVSSPDHTADGFAMTDADGRYSVSALTAGSYTVEFVDGRNSGLISEYYDNAADARTAKSVSVGNAATVSGINAALDMGATITGTVTKDGASGTVPSANGYVSAYTTANHEFAGSGSTDAAGRYSIPGLRAGSYKVVFESSDTSVVSGKWYHDASGFASATPVVVADKTTVPGIDENLEKAGTISGTMTQNGGAAPADTVLQASVYSAETGEELSSATADAAGHYTVSSLMAGTYKVGFRAYQSGTGLSSGLAPEFYDNVSTLDAAKSISVGAALAVPGIDADLTNAAPPTVNRLSGSDRFSTSAAISAATFKPGVAVAYVANGGNFPDALSAAPVAGKDCAPVLLVAADTISAPVQAELTRLKPGRIVVLGGVNAVSEAVATQLKGYTSGEVTRAAGAGRFETSAAISAAAFTPGVPVAYIANGYNFPDALSGASVAAKDGAPVLLVPAGSIPDVIQAELARLKPGRIVVLGGANAVTDAVKTSLQAYTGGTVTRLSGVDRFATSAAISAGTFTPGAPVVYIANGYNFPDALSGAPIAGIDNAPVLLVPADSIPAAIQAELTRLKPGRIVVLGGVNAVNAAVAQQLSGYITTP